METCCLAWLAVTAVVAEFLVLLSPQNLCSGRQFLRGKIMIVCPDLHKTCVYHTSATHLGLYVQQTSRWLSPENFVSPELKHLP